MQPTYAIRSLPISCGNPLFRAMSLTASRPPGFRTRAISRKTAVLSGARLITQFEITQSTEASGSGSLSMVARWYSMFASPDLAAFRRARSIISWVMSIPDRFACGTDLACRKEHVQSPTAAQVHDHLAFPQAGNGGRIPAGQPHVRLGGDGGEFLGRVAERLGDGLDTFVVGREPAVGDRPIFVLHRLHDRLGHVPSPVRLKGTTGSGGSAPASSR